MKTKHRFLTFVREKKLTLTLLAGLFTCVLFIFSNKLKLSQKNILLKSSDSFELFPEEELRKYNTLSNLDTISSSLEVIEIEEEGFEEINHEISEDDMNLPISLFEEEALDEELDSDRPIKYIDINPSIVPVNPGVVVNYRTKKCTYFCQLVLENGYKLQKKSSSYPKSYPPELLLINFQKYGFYSSMKHTIVNMIGRGSSCIGGGKGRQLNCKNELVNEECKFDDLKIQPPQTNIQMPKDCMSFFERETLKNESKIYIAKPGGSFHGKGITIHSNLNEMKRHFGNCKRVLNDGIIVQEYIKTSALMDGHKFDFRTYLLVASTDPFLIFYHDGFVRKAEGKYSTDEESLKDPLKQVTNDVSQSSEGHFFNFKQLEKKLFETYSNFNEDFLTKEFVPHAMRVSNFLFYSAKQGYKGKGMVPTKGRYQLFALDWMIDESGGFHLLEGNGNPLITDYKNIELTPELWTSMIELEKMVHIKPEEFSESLSVEEGFEYKGWKLVHNQREVEDKNEIYKPCMFNEYQKQNHPLFSYNNYAT